MSDAQGGSDIHVLKGVIKALLHLPTVGLGLP